MQGHDLRHGVHRLEQARFKIALGKGTLHRRNHRRPAFNMDVHTPISHHVNGVLGQQHINQNAVVALGVPDPQFGKQHQSALRDQFGQGSALAHTAPQITARQMGFHADPNLPAVQALALRHLGLNPRQTGLGQDAATAPHIGHGMPPPQGQGLQPR